MSENNCIATVRRTRADSAKVFNYREAKVHEGRRTVQSALRFMTIIVSVGNAQNELSCEML